MDEYMYRQALRYLNACYALIDNTYSEFKRENYKDLPELSKRLAKGERSLDLYEAIMNFAI